MKTTGVSSQNKFRNKMQSKSKKVEDSRHEEDPELLMSYVPMQGSKNSRTLSLDLTHSIGVRKTHDSLIGMKNVIHTQGIEEEGKSSMNNTLYKEYANRNKKKLRTSSLAIYNMTEINEYGNDNSSSFFTNPLIPATTKESSGTGTGISSSLSQSVAFNNKKKLMKTKSGNATSFSKYLNNININSTSASNGNNHINFNLTSQNLENTQKSQKLRSESSSKSKSKTKSKGNNSHIFNNVPKSVNVSLNYQKSVQNKNSNHQGQHQLFGITNPSNASNGTSLCSQMQLNNHVNYFSNNNSTPSNFPLYTNYVPCTTTDSNYNTNSNIQIKSDHVKKSLPQGNSRNINKNTNATIALQPCATVCSTYSANKNRSKAKIQVSYPKYSNASSTGKNSKGGSLQGTVSNYEACEKIEIIEKNQKIEKNEKLNNSSNLNCLNMNSNLSNLQNITLNAQRNLCPSTISTQNFMSESTNDIKESLINEIKNNRENYSKPNLLSKEKSVNVSQDFYKNPGSQLSKTPNDEETSIDDSELPLSNETKVKLNEIKHSIIELLNNNRQKSTILKELENIYRYVIKVNSPIASTCDEENLNSNNSNQRKSILSSTNSFSNSVNFNVSQIKSSKRNTYDKEVHLADFESDLIKKENENLKNKIEVIDKKFDQICTENKDLKNYIKEKTENIEDLKSYILNFQTELNEMKKQNQMTASISLAQNQYNNNMLIRDSFSSNNYNNNKNFQSPNFKISNTVITSDMSNKLYFDKIDFSLDDKNFSIDQISNKKSSSNSNLPIYKGNGNMISGNLIPKLKFDREDESVEQNEQEENEKTGCFADFLNKREKEKDINKNFEDSAYVDQFERGKKIFILKNKNFGMKNYN